MLQRAAERTANTIAPIKLDLEKLSVLEFKEFVIELIRVLECYKDTRYAYYEKLRRERSKWANGARKFLAVLGTLGILLTALAATIRLGALNGLTPYGLDQLDVWAFALALGLYAVMGAISFYENATDNTGAYFRHLGVVLAIRDLWTKLQFAMFKELAANKDADVAAQASARERVTTLAEAFCSDLNKLTAAELNEWRSEFLASLSELEAAAKRGTEDVQRQLEEVLKEYKKNAEEAKKAADDAAKPAIINVSIATEFDDQVVVLIDDAEVARTRLSQFPVNHIRPGLRKIQARAKKGGKDLEVALMRDLKAGLQDVSLSLG